MVWFMVALILGSFGFAAATVIHYKAVLDQFQPRIRTEEANVEKLEKAVERETSLRKQDAEKREALKLVVVEQKNKFNELKRNIGLAEQQQESLEMDLQKSEFKKAKER